MTLNNSAEFRLCMLVSQEIICGVCQAFNVPYLQVQKLFDVISKQPPQQIDTHKNIKIWKAFFYTKVQKTTVENETGIENLPKPFSYAKAKNKTEGIKLYIIILCCTPKKTALSAKHDTSEAPICGDVCTCTC